MKFKNKMKDKKNNIFLLNIIVHVPYFKFICEMFIDFKSDPFGCCPFTQWDSYKEQCVGKVLFLLIVKFNSILHEKSYRNQ